ncbi:hypothetical protein DL95DRAFT_319997, partial [Leptodontidium sp. 2 PMI_412]
SLSLALQSLSVLSLSGSMTTYLLSVYYTLPLLPLARTFSSVVKLSSTILMPWAISLVSTSSTNPLTPLRRRPLIPYMTAVFFISLALSRLGMWMYSLVAQTLVQIMVPATQRVEFSGIEVGFSSAAELARWGLTAIWSQPEQSKGVAAIGMTIVSLCTGSYWMWMWRWGG